MRSTDKTTGDRDRSRTGSNGEELTRRQPVAGLPLQRDFRGQLDDADQRLARNPSALKPQDVLQLQRAIGNRATEARLRGVLERPAAAVNPPALSPQARTSYAGQPLQRYEWEQTDVAPPPRVTFQRSPATAPTVQRAPGLPTKGDLRGKGLKPGKKLIGTQTWADLETALDEYRALSDEGYEAQRRKLGEIQGYIDTWKSGHLNKSGFVKKSKEQGKYDELLSIEQQIANRLEAIEIATAPVEEIPRQQRRQRETPPRLGEEGGFRQRRAHVFRPQIVLVEEKSVGEQVKEALQTIGGYKEDRNYMSWGAGALPHVGWKAHVGAAAGDRVGMTQAAGAVLRKFGVFHKFDISGAGGTIEKFITIYPPEDEESWAVLIETLEPVLAEFGRVAVTHDMAVGETGQVHMRHGQNTPLTQGILDESGITLEESGAIGDFPRYTGEAIAFMDLPLLSIKGGPFFFNKSGETPPETLTPETVYMAILFNGKIVPDRREEPNPANAPLPTGVSEFEEL